ncbi:MAG: hypothetical protein WCD54_24820, partial [Pseudolabrys sp.]
LLSASSNGPAATGAERLNIRRMAAMIRIKDYSTAPSAIADTSHHMEHQALSALYQPWRLSSSYSLNVGLLGGH